MPTRQSRSNGSLWQSAKIAASTARSSIYAAAFAKKPAKPPSVRKAASWSPQTSEHCKKGNRIMLVIRMARAGTKKRPFYHIVVADSRAPRDGRFIERLGYFNPLLPKDKIERLKWDIEKAKAWMAKGARPSDRVMRFLDAAGVLKRPKRNNPEKAVPRKERKAKEEAAKAAAGAPGAAAPPAAAAPAAGAAPVA